MKKTNLIDLLKKMKGAYDLIVSDYTKENPHYQFIDGYQCALVVVIALLENNNLYNDIKDIYFNEKR